MAKIIDKIKWWILEHIIKDDIIEEYAQDKELLHDYYNSEPVDYYHDYDQINNNFKFVNSLFNLLQWFNLNDRNNFKYFVNLCDYSFRESNKKKNKEIGIIL